MELAAKRFADTVALFPAGRLDHSTSDGFKAALAPHLAACTVGGDRVVIDLAGVEYISSVGLRVLMLASKQAKLEFSVSHTFGGSSSCVQLETDGPDYVLCDLGSGARAFGNALLATRGPAIASTSSCRISTGDHIMGFPFFMPAYLPGNHVRIYGCHDTLEEAFRRQNARPLSRSISPGWNARIEFVRLEPEHDHDIAGLRVRAKLQHHGGDSYGYRIEQHGKVVVYSTDPEHKQDAPEEVKAFVEFFRDADLVIFDAQYSLADAISVKEDWGHSSNVVGVEMCQLARARRLCLYHHEPIPEANETGAFRPTLRGLAGGRQRPPEPRVAPSHPELSRSV